MSYLLAARNILTAVLKGPKYHPPECKSGRGLEA